MDAQRDFGKYLQNERELRRVSLCEVAEATRIPERSLRYLEQGELSLLPAEVFVKGFVRAYARHLGLSEVDTLGRFRQTMVASADEEAVRQTEAVGDAASEVSMRRQFGLALFVIILLIIVTITFSLLWGSGATANPHASLEAVKASLVELIG